MRKLFFSLVAVLVTLAAAAKPKNDAYLMIYFSDSNQFLENE